ATLTTPYPTRRSSDLISDFDKILNAGAEMSTTQTLAGKKVVVIGGTSGIGLATAVAAAELGATVWAAGRSAEHREKAEKVAAGQIGRAHSELQSRENL